MNKKTKKLISLTAAAVIALGSAGCGKKAPQKGENGETKLKYLFTGAGKLLDSDTVWSKFNEKLKEQIPDLQIEFQNVATTDYAEKWRLMMAAQEHIDIAWAGYVLDLTSEVGKNAFMPLDDLLDEYGQDLKASMPSWVFDKSKINGKLYFIPCYQAMADQNAVGMKTPRALADKYLDVDAFNKAFGDSNKILTRDDFKVIEDYCEALKKDGKLGKGISPSFLSFFANRLGWPRDLQPIIKNAYYKSESEDFNKVYDVNNDFPASLEYYKMTRDWFEKGYIRNDILGLSDWSSDEGKEDGYALWAHYINFEQEKSDSERYGMDIKVLTLSDKVYANHTPSPTNTAIVNGCQAPEKAMQFINLINSEKGKELYNMLVYGLEDVHYKKIGDDRVEMILNGSAWSSQNKYGYQAWILGNTMNAYYNQFQTDGNKEWTEALNERTIVSPLMGFSFDTLPVTNEIAQYDSIMKEYSDIGKGAFANWEDMLNERNKKLEIAGSDKIVEEAQKQLDEWLKKYGKKGE